MRKPGLRKCKVNRVIDLLCSVGFHHESSEMTLVLIQPEFTYNGSRIDHIMCVRI